MSKKHYIAIAEAIRSAVETCEMFETDTSGAEIAALRIADKCAADNPRFDRAHFLDACGVEN